MIEVFAEIACPFTHAGLRRLRTTRDASGVDTPIRVRAWPLELINSAPLDPALLAREIEALRAEVASDLFDGFDADRFPTTSIPAFGLAAGAYEVDVRVGEAVSFAIRTALFEEGRDISDPIELRRLADEFGVPMCSARYADAVARADWNRGRLRGVVGSPHFFVGDRDFFCPSLAIEHADDRFTVHMDLARLTEFYDTALGLAT